MSADPTRFSVTEGIEGTFRYHLSPVGSHTRSLCGKPTMLTQIPISAWGTQTHLREKWCQACMDQATQDDATERNPTSC